MMTFEEAIKDVKCREYLAHIYNCLLEAKHKTGWDIRGEIASSMCYLDCISEYPNRDTISGPNYYLVMRRDKRNPNVVETLGVYATRECAVDAMISDASRTGVFSVEKLEEILGDDWENPEWHIHNKRYDYQMRTMYSCWDGTGSTLNVFSDWDHTSTYKK